MPATVRLGTCSFADEGLVKTWYPRGVSTSKARLALLRRALRHGRGRLALLPPPRPGGDRALGAAHAARVHVPREGARDDDGARGRAERRGVRRVPRVARAARALREAPRDPPAVPPAVREVGRGDGRARARSRAPRSARPARRVPAPVVDGAGRARRHARVPRAQRARVRLRRHADDARVERRRRGTRPRPTRSPTSASTAATRRRGTSRPRSRRSASTGCTRRRSSRSGSRSSAGSPSEADEVYALFNNNRDDFAPRSAVILRGLLDEAGVPAAGGVEPPPERRRSSDLALRSSGHGAARSAHETAPRRQLAGMCE